MCGSKSAPDMLNCTGMDDLKNLSQKRQNLNLKLESTEKSIQDLYKKIETMRLVGSDYSEVSADIEKLILVGERLAFEISHIENEIRLIRQDQDTFLDTF